MENMHTDIKVQKVREGKSVILLQLNWRLKFEGKSFKQ